MVDRSGPLFGFILVFGWLLSFLMGVLQRIMPFLASMHSVRPGAKPILVSRLVAEKPLRLHMVCHLAALALVSAGIVLMDDRVIRVGALAGVIGACGYGAFAGHLGWKLIQNFKIA